MKSFFRLLKKLMAKRNLTWARACFFLMVVLVIAGVLWKGSEAWAGSLTGGFSGWSQATCYSAYGVNGFTSDKTTHDGSITIGTNPPTEVQSSIPYIYTIPDGSDLSQSRYGVENWKYEVAAPSFQQAYYAKLHLLKSIKKPQSLCCPPDNPYTCNCYTANGCDKHFCEVLGAPAFGVPCPPDLLSGHQCQDQFCTYTDYSGYVGGGVEMMTVGSGGEGQAAVNGQGSLYLCDPGNSCPAGTDDYLFAQNYNTLDFVSLDTSAFGPNPVAWTFTYGGNSTTENVNGTGGNIVVQKPFYPISILVYLDKNGKEQCFPESYCVGSSCYSKCLNHASRCGTVNYYADSESAPASVESYSTSGTDSYLFRLGNYTKAWNESGGWSPSTAAVANIDGRFEAIYYYNIINGTLAQAAVGTICSTNGTAWGSPAWYSCSDQGGKEPTSENMGDLDTVLESYYNCDPKSYLSCDLGNPNSTCCPYKLKTFNIVQTTPPGYTFPKTSPDSSGDPNATRDYIIQQEDASDGMKAYARQVPAMLVDAGCDVDIPHWTPPSYPSLSCIVTVDPPDQANIGDAVIWAAVPSGGSGSYSYNWSGDLGNAAGTVGDVQQFSTSYSNVGDKNDWMSVQVTVSSDNQTATCSNKVKILKPLKVSCFASPNPADVGDGIKWTANPTGGTGEYSLYTWSGKNNDPANLGAACGSDPQCPITGTIESDSQSYFTTVYRAGIEGGGSKDVKIEVIDSAGNTVSNLCSLQVNGPTVSCQGVPANPDIGEPVTWSASVYPPPGPDEKYSYSWTGVPDLGSTCCDISKPECVPTDSSESITAPSFGTYYCTDGGEKQATVTVTLSHSTISASCKINVGPPPTSLFQDIGLRIYNGLKTIAIAIAIEKTLTSPLRIFKNGVTYGIRLVSLGDSNDSGVRIQTSSGPQALRKCNLSSGECR